MNHLKGLLEDSLVQHETSDLDEIMSQLKSHIFLKEKSLNDSKIKIKTAVASYNSKENFNNRQNNNRKLYDLDEYMEENKKNGGETVNSINSDSKEKLKSNRNNRKNHGKSVDYRKSVELSNNRMNNEEIETDFIQFTSNNPQTEDSDGKSSRKYFESSREIDFFVSSDCS